MNCRFPDEKVILYRVWELSLAGQEKLKLYTNKGTECAVEVARESAAGV
jgi:hypothetical protein